MFRFFPLFFALILTLYKSTSSFLPPQDAHLSAAEEKTAPEGGKKEACPEGQAFEYGLRLPG